DPPLQFAQSGSRLEPELAQLRPNRCEVLQRIRLSPAPVEREHGELVGTLAERVLFDERERLPERVRVPAETELRRQPLPERDQPQFLEAFALGPDDLFVRQLPISAAAPQRERLFGERRRERRISLTGRRLALTEKPLEPRRVEPLRREFERVRTAV